MPCWRQRAHLHDDVLLQIGAFAHAVIRHKAHNVLAVAQLAHQLHLILHVGQPSFNRHLHAQLRSIRRIAPLHLVALTIAAFADQLTTAPARRTRASALAAPASDATQHHGGAPVQE